jgi:hypothetical protein
MSYNKTSTGSNDTGLWLEYALILILVVIVVAAVVPLIEPFVQSQILSFCASQGPDTTLFFCPQKPL